MNDGSCSVSGCPHSAFCRGWCRTHYNRWHRSGDIQADRPVNVRKVPAAPGELCEVVDCSRPMTDRPWCAAHHRRWLKLGAVQADKPNKPRGGPMGTVPCSIAGCPNPSRTRTWCHAHYRRWRKTGSVLEDVDLRSYGDSPEERFWEKVDKNGPFPAARPELGPCHLWTGGLNSTGYGVFNTGSGAVGAHHAGWTMTGGAPVAKGLVLDHLCRVRHCVRRTHLEPVTQRVNSSRTLRTACINGHPYDDANTYRDPKG